MVGPERKRHAVCHVRHPLEVSERRAGATIEQPRSTQRYEGLKQEKDAVLATELRRISRERPRAGYRMATALLSRGGAYHCLNLTPSLRSRAKKRHREGTPAPSVRESAPSGIISAPSCAIGAIGYGVYNIFLSLIWMKGPIFLHVLRPQWCRWRRMMP